MMTSHSISIAPSVGHKTSHARWEPLKTCLEFYHTKKNAVVGAGRAKNVGSLLSNKRFNFTVNSRRECHERLGKLNGGKRLAMTDPSGHASGATINRLMDDVRVNLCLMPLAMSAVLQFR